MTRQILKGYRIMNRITKEWAEVAAPSAQEACEKAGWRIADCYVRVRTLGRGWGKPKEESCPKKHNKTSRT